MELPNTVDCINHCHNFQWTVDDIGSDTGEDKMELEYQASAFVNCNVTQDDIITRTDHSIDYRHGIAWEAKYQSRYG
jgi:hypothetical protein